MKSLKITVLNLLIILALAGCTAIEDGYIKPPLVYRIDIQQGNVVDQNMINRLKVGMDEKQVRFIMGTPLLIDPFHPDRWDYLYFYQKGGKDAEQRHITVYFEDGKLSHLGGDIKVTHLPIKEDTTRTEKSVVVPDGYKDEGLLDRWLDKKPELREKPETQEAKLEEATESDAVDTESIEDDLKETSEVESIDTESIVEDLPSPEEQVSETAAPEVEEAEDDEPGFFSRMWDKIVSDDDEEATDDTGVLEPELESR